MSDRHEHPARQVLVIAPHADDEVIGCGGLIAGLSTGGAAVDVVVMTVGGVLHRNQEHALPSNGRMKELLAAAAVLGVRHVSVLFQGTEMHMDARPQIEIVTALDRVLDAISYDEVFVPPNDQNADHRICHYAAMSALRLGARPPPSLIASYESAPELSWGSVQAFSPTLFVDISKQWATKTAAMECYASQMRAAPHPRSLETLEKMAFYRGAQCGAQFAEAFNVLRIVR